MFRSPYRTAFALDDGAEWHRLDWSGRHKMINDTASAMRVLGEDPTRILTGFLMDAFPRGVMIGMTDEIPVSQECAPEIRTGIGRLLFGRVRPMSDQEGALPHPNRFYDPDPPEEADTWQREGWRGRIDLLSCGWARHSVSEHRPEFLRFVRQVLLRAHKEGVLGVSEKTAHIVPVWTDLRPTPHEDEPSIW